MRIVINLIRNLKKNTVLTKVDTSSFDEPPLTEHEEDQLIRGLRDIFTTLRKQQDKTTL